MSLTLERVLLAVLTIAVVVLLMQAYQFRIELEHIISLIMLAGALWLIYDGYRAYKGAHGNVLQRLAAAFRYSATILWARVVMIIGLLFDGAEKIAGIVGEPSVANAIQNFASAKVAGGLLIGSAVVTEMARRRKGSADPVVAAAGEAAPIVVVTAPVTGITGPTGVS